MEPSPSSLAPIRTRVLQIEDYAAVAALWNEVEGVEIAEGDSLEEIRGYLARNPGLSRVALAGEKIIGAVLCGHDGRRGFIYHLAVAASGRGRGVGQRLVDECVAGLAAAGVTRAIILVASENTSGRTFWQNRGWDEITGAIPMARDLP